MDVSFPPLLLFSFSFVFLSFVSIPVPPPKANTSKRQETNGRQGKWKQQISIVTDSLIHWLVFLLTTSCALSNVFPPPPLPPPLLLSLPLHPLPTPSIQTKTTRQFFYIECNLYIGPRFHFLFHVLSLATLSPPGVSPIAGRLLSVN